MKHTQIYRQHSRGARHDYHGSYLLLDVDMSGLPCGPKAACATKGYFAQQRKRRGRQLGSVVATRYDEVVVDRLFDGKTQLTRALQPVVLAAERTLQLDDYQRGGGIETFFKGDKQGLGLTKRSKNVSRLSKWSCCWAPWPTT